MGGVDLLLVALGVFGALIASYFLGPALRRPRRELPKPPPQDPLPPMLIDNGAEDDRNRAVVEADARSEALGAIGGSATPEEDLAARMGRSRPSSEGG